MELLPSFWPHRAIALGAFVWFGKRGSLTRRPLLPLNAGTAEPVRVSPPEAVAYLLELMPNISTAGPIRLRAAYVLSLCCGTAVHRLLKRCANTLGKPVQPSVSTARATPIIGWRIYCFVAR